MQFQAKWSPLCLKAALKIDTRDHVIAFMKHGMIDRVKLLLM